MDNRHQKNEVDKLLVKLDNLEKTLSQILKDIEDYGETLEYLRDLVYRYLNLTEKSKRTESLMVNILFSLVGFLLGFALALLLFK